MPPIPSVGYTPTRPHLKQTFHTENKQLYSICNTDANHRGKMCSSKKNLPERIRTGGVSVFMSKSVPKRAPLPLVRVRFRFRSTSHRWAQSHDGSAGNIYCFHFMSVINNRHESKAALGWPLSARRRAQKPECLHS